MTVNHSQQSQVKEPIEEYRDHLINTLRFLNESYDKLLVTLSGGALALSIAFLKDIDKLNKVVHSELLFAAWIAFIVSLTSVLGRVMTGIKAQEKAIDQVDKGTIYSDKPGGNMAFITEIMFYLSAISLVIGLILIACFSYHNVGG